MEEEQKKNDLSAILTSASPLRKNDITITCNRNKDRNNVYMNYY